MVSITNLTNTTLPYNTTLPANPLYFTQIITQNIPWFFPFILFLAFIWVDYMLEIHSEMGGRKTFVVSAVAYTFLMYLIVAGGLTTSAMFFLFESIALAGFFFEAIFNAGWP